MTILGCIRFAAALATTLGAFPQRHAFGQAPSNDRRLGVEVGLARRETGDIGSHATRSGKTWAIAIELPQSGVWTLRVVGRRDDFANTIEPGPVFDRAPAKARFDRIGELGASANWNPSMGDGTWLRAVNLDVSVRRYFGASLTGAFIEPLVGLTKLSAPGSHISIDQPEPVQHTYRLSPGMTVGYLVQVFSRVSLSVQTGIRSTKIALDGDGGGSPNWLAEPVSAGLAFRW